MTLHTAEAKEEPPVAIEVNLSLSINQPKWLQYQQEGYSQSEIEKMLEKDIIRAISKGSYDTINRLIDGLVTTIEIGDYY